MARSVDARSAAAAAIAVAALALPLLLTGSIYAQSEENIYSYVNKEGRTVFVNGSQRVPPAYRKKAVPVDLSDTSLNIALGTELQQAIEREYQQLIKSDPCLRARQKAERPWLANLWSTQGHLLTLGLLALALVLCTPWMVRRIKAPVWSRTLAWMLPLLLGVALLSIALQRFSKSEKRGKQTATACQPNNPRAKDARGQAGIIRQLRQELDEAHGVRKNAIDRALKEKL